MKKTLIVALLTIFVGTTAFEAPVKPIEHPVKPGFEKSFNVPSKISTEKYDAIIFNIHGLLIKKFYSKDGDYLGTTKSFAYNKLPAKALSILNTKYSYPGYELKECIKSESADGIMNYYVSLKKNNRILMLEISRGGSVSVCNAA